MHVKMPLYARVSAVAGRPIVLVAALAMSAPGEYAMALHAGWSPRVAWLMPVCVSVYAAVAAVIAATRPKGVSGRRSAMVGAGIALALALAAQVVAHLIAAGYMTMSGFLVAATSCVPPIVVAHMLHLAAVPKADTEADSGHAQADSPGQVTALPYVPADMAPALADMYEDLADLVAKTPDIVAEETAAMAGQVATQADTSQVGGVDEDTHAPTKPVKGPDMQQLKAAANEIYLSGETVNGTTLAAYFGVSGRTGRRYVDRLKADLVTAATQADMAAD